MYSIQKPAQAEIEIKHSRFICYLYPVRTEEEAREYIQKHKKEEWKARHHCSAFILGDKQEIQRSNDDGEPAGTAGMPILEVLQKGELTNIVAIVVRYFGGIKLGKGGLIRAYCQATKEALEQATIVEKKWQKEVTLYYDYALIDSLQYYLSQYQYVIVDTTYTTEVSTHLMIDVEEEENFCQSIEDRFASKIRLCWGEVQEIEVPVSSLLL